MEPDVEQTPLLRRPSFGSSSSPLRSFKYRFFAIILGQLLSILLCLSAVTSVYLTTSYSLALPTFQNFLFYCVLTAVFTSALACRGTLFSATTARGWRYFLLALCDAEANFLVVKAYQYTTLTSVQLLDCFTIPTVLLLSRFLLGIRYRVVHVCGVVVCLVGVGCLVWADILEGIPAGQGNDRLLGDVLCLAGAFLYGVSNVAQEFLVKSYDMVEFLGMIGVFGAIITGLQTVILELDRLTAATSSTALLHISGLLGGFALTQFTFYILAAVLMKMSSATVYNLSILTADFYSLVVGIYLFQYHFHLLYFVAFSLVLIGVSVFSLKPTTTFHQDVREVPESHTSINSEPPAPTETENSS